MYARYQLKISLFRLLTVEFFRQAVIQAYWLKREFFQKPAEIFFVLSLIHRTGTEHQSAAFFHIGRGIFQDRSLEMDQLVLLRL